MTYQEAKNRVAIKWLVGTIILIPSAISTIISILKMFYFGFDKGDVLTHALAQPIKKLVSLAYHQTTFLEFFWLHSPIPVLPEVFTYQNTKFFIVYALTFIGLIFIGSGRALSQRITKIDKQIEDEMIKASIQGGKIRNKIEIQNSIPIQKPSLFSQLHAMYLAPLIIGLIIAIITKLTGLT